MRFKTTYERLFCDIKTNKVWMCELLQYLENDYFSHIFNSHNPGSMEYKKVITISIDSGCLFLFTQISWKWVILRYKSVKKLVGFIWNDPHINCYFEKQYTHHTMLCCSTTCIALTFGCLCVLFTIIVSCCGTLSNKALQLAADTARRKSWTWCCVGVVFWCPWQ